MIASAFTPVIASMLSQIDPSFYTQVINVDDEGMELGSGVMELTQRELVLHLHRRDAVRWPYLCLRRYGFDSNLFSFESGRRCQTGQGEHQPLFSWGRRREETVSTSFYFCLHLLLDSLPPPKESL